MLRQPLACACFCCPVRPPAGREGTPEVFRSMHPPFSFRLAKKTAPAGACRRPTATGGGSWAGGKRAVHGPKEKTLRRRDGPNGPSLRVTGVVRIGPAGVDGPAVPAPDPSREELHPRTTALGGRTGCKTELAYFCSRAFRSAARCPGGRGEPSPWDGTCRESGSRFGPQSFSPLAKTGALFPSKTPTAAAQPAASPQMSRQCAAERNARKEKQRQMRSAPQRSGQGGYAGARLFNCRGGTQGRRGRRG